MVRVSKIIVAIAVTGAVGATSASGAGTVKLKKVTQPPRVATAGDEIKIKARLVNRTAKTRKASLKMTLAGGPSDYNLERTIIDVDTSVLARGFKRYTIRFTVPPASQAGKYRVRTCLKPQGSRKRCRVSRVMRVETP